MQFPFCKKESPEVQRVVETHGASIEYKSLPRGFKYATNEVISSKYTWWNFIFLNLFEQFSNMANVYFLLIGILQIVPQFTTSAGLPTMYYPLAFIIVVSGIRAIVEDVARHRADAKRNGYLYDVLSTDESGETIWKPTKSGDLRVGGIIRLKKNETIPSDMLLLGTSNPKGHCFIDKANLNGETKLEVYSSIRQTRYAIPTLPEGSVQQDILDRLAEKPNQELINLKMELDYELPNKIFDSFRGTIVLNNTADGSSANPNANATSQTGEQQGVELMSSPRSDDVEGNRVEVRCTGHDLLMRETNLKNTDYVVGLIVYTGNDTKIQKSNLDGEKPKMKVSKVMRLVNLYLIWMFLFQCALCVLGGILAGVWYKNNAHSWYFDFDNTSSSEAVIVGVYAFFTWMINLSYLVPISLVVSGEMVKFIMSFFINSDIYLYHPVIRKPTNCNSSTIHEDLGLVNYICSDKTGTLTQNQMQFRYAMCNDTTQYGSKMTDIAKAVQQRAKEMEERAAGTYKPKPPQLWSDLVEKYHPPRKPNKESGYDIECCNKNCCLRGRRCPNWCRFFFWSKKPFVVPGQRDLFASDDFNEEDIFTAINPNLAGESSNSFTKQEKKFLLDKLYNSTSETQRVAIEKYMLHMTLSNTVKPYFEGPKEAPVLKFQPESAEELAMVQFATQCGFTKLPEKEEHEKTAEEKRLGANTFITIQPMNPKTLKNEGPAHHRSYAFLAVFGFTSARARVTLVYQDIETGRILCMIKGQDTTVMPYVSLGKTPDDILLNTLKDCSDNGLRTLVAGHAEKTYEWWKPWGEKYNNLKQQALDEKARAVAEHQLFEAIEKDAGFEFLGCIGLEDQLQPLVPETIQACLRASIKVWMITGDKLETARNIGLACNLIDADMQPQVKAGDTVQAAMSALQESRLIEITGEWNQLFQNTAELKALFDIIDFNHDGHISVAEISILMQTLHTGITEEKVVEMVKQMLVDQLNDSTRQQKQQSQQPQQPQLQPDHHEHQHQHLSHSDSHYHTPPDVDKILTPISPGGQGQKKKKSRREQDGLALYDDEHEPSEDSDFPDDENPPSSRLTTSPSRLTQSIVDLHKLTINTQDPRTITIDKESFVAILQKFERSPYEAILYDVNEGLERFKRINDHLAYPLSILVSRDAFLVMFPEQGGVHDPRFPVPTPEQLEDLRRSFFFLANVSKSLIFARAQPSMKKKMVTEIQLRYPEAITLAIGDGANDTDMITAAHIGIGIAGVEGTAATNSADYAIGTFRMLHTLLFVHGFWSYQRVASMVNFIFYKAALLAFTQFLFGIHSAFSGQQFFNDFLLQIYNIIMTSLPIIVLAIMDKHIPRQTAENNVVAYKEQQYQSFNLYVFSLWILRSLLHSALLYFIPFICLLSENPFPSYANSTTGGGTYSNGTMDLWYFSTTVYFATSLLPNINVLFITKSIQLINVIVVLLSVIAVFLFPWVFSLPFLLMINPDMTGSVQQMYSSPTWWLVLVMTCSVPLLAELSWQVLLVQYFPSLTQILQEQLYVTRKQEKALNKTGIVQVVPASGEPKKDQISRNAETITSDVSATSLTTHTQDQTRPSSAQNPLSPTHRVSDLELKVSQPKLSRVNTPQRKMTIIQSDGTVLSTHDGGATLKLETPVSPAPGGPDAPVIVQPMSPKAKHAMVRLERPVLQPEDEHVWLEVKSDNVFTRSALSTLSTNDNIVQAVIEYNKSQLNQSFLASPLTSPKEPVSGPRKLFKTLRRASNAHISPPQEYHVEDAMRSGFVRALLRFRNQTSSIFDSAAQSQLHTTTTATSPNQAQLNAAAMYDQQSAPFSKPLPINTDLEPLAIPATTTKPAFEDDQNDPDSIEIQGGVEISFEESVCRSVKE